MRNPVLIAAAVLVGVGCSVISDPGLRVLRLSYVGAAEADLQFMWHVMSGDTVRVEATTCELISRLNAPVEYRDCRPATADFVADNAVSPLGSVNGVQRVDFVVGDTFTRRTGVRSGEFLIDASNGRGLASVNVVNFLVRRLFVQTDSLVVAVGDTVPVPLVGERTDGEIERRLAELPAVSIVRLKGASSPVEIVRGGHRFPPIPAPDYSRLPRGAEDFIQSQLVFVVGRAAGRDTLEIRTRSRMLRVPVVVEP